MHLDNYVSFIQGGGNIYGAKVQLHKIFNMYTAILDQSQFLS